MSEWSTRIKVLVLSAIFISISNGINTYKARLAGNGAFISPFESMPGLITMVVIVLIGCGIQQLVESHSKIHLPTILYISMLAIFVSIPGVSPIANFVNTEFNKVGLLPLCTPILAYAGISIGKDLDEFKKQGVAIICVSLCAFLGTYIGSAIISQLVLKITGVI